MSDNKPDMRDNLIEETLSAVQSVGADSNNADSTNPSLRPEFRDALVEVLSPKDRLEADREMMKRRVEKFRANQQKFQREREEYYAKTLEAARATQFAEPKSTLGDPSTND